jgi:translocation and assembly module TamB
LTTKGSLASQDDWKSLTLQSGSASFAGLDVGWDQPIRFTRDPQELRLMNSTINLGQGAVHLHARLRRGSDLQVGVQARGLDLNELPPKQLRNVTGQLQSDLSVSGTLQDPRVQLTAQLSKVKSDIETARDMPPLSATLEGTYDGEMIQASLKAYQVDLNRLRAQAQLPASLSLHPFQLAARDISGHLSGHLDLNRMNRLVPLDGQQYGGELDLDLKLSGPYQEPVLDGDFELKQGNYENAVSGLALTDIEMSGTVHDRTLAIEALQASDSGQGKLFGKGRLELKPDGGLNVELTARFDSARLIRLDMAQGSVDGTLQLQGSSERASVTGNLSIFPLEISLPEPGPPGTSGLIIRQQEETTLERDLPGQANNATDDSLLSRTDLDIGVTLPRGTFVRGRGLDSEWQAGLEIQGKASAPKINGQIQSVRGHLNLLTKRFSLTEGTITFANEFPPQPLLDITATHQAKEITVMVRVIGPAGEPSIRLESEPAYPRDEILARLLFNRELSTITPVQAVKLALAIRTLTSGDQSMMDKTRSLLGLDELDIEVGGQEEGTTVGVGKYLREDIYFEVEKGLDSETGQVSVDIEISPRFSLETKAGTLNQGVTFKWNYQY